MALLTLRLLCDFHKERLGQTPTTDTALAIAPLTPDWLFDFIAQQQHEDETRVTLMKSLGLHT